MSRHKQKWIRKKFIAHDLYKFVRWLCVDQRVFFDEAKKVWLLGGTVVPITAAAVLQARNLEGAADFSRLGKRLKCISSKKSEQQYFDDANKFHCKDKV